MGRAAGGRREHYLVCHGVRDPSRSRETLKILDTPSTKAHSDVEALLVGNTRPGVSRRRALFFALPRRICTKTSVDGLVACKDYFPCATGAVLATNRVRPGSGTGLPF